MKLLKRLLPAQDVDALLGDISEEAPRRSRLWYWSQLFAVFIVGSWSDIRAHKAMALRASAVGFIWLMLGGYVFIGIREILTGAGFIWHGTSRVLSIASAMSPGWIIVRLHRAHGLTMVLAFRIAWMALTATIFIWYAILSSLRPDRGALLSSLADQFQRVLILNFAIGSLWMFAGGLLAIRWTNPRILTDRRA